VALEMTQPVFTDKGGREMSLMPRILVIDDEPDITAYFCTLLSENGFIANSANSADDGLGELEEGRPDLILLDLLMPLKTGINLFNKIRKDERYKSIPIIIVSGIHDRFSKDYKAFFEGLRHGKPCAFVEKPIKPEDLLRLVNQTLGLTN
jgi:CheY-like chemotaxis protein